MTTLDPERQEMAERDRDTVLNCDHGAIELNSATANYLHGEVQIDILACATCPTLVQVAIAQDPRDDMYARLPLGN